MPWNTNDPVARAEAWWALIARILTFIGGMALMAYIVISKDNRAYLVGIALTALGLPVAGIVRSALQGASKKEDQ